MTNQLIKNNTHFNKLMIDDMLVYYTIHKKTCHLEYFLINFLMDSYYLQVFIIHI